MTPRMSFRVKVPTFQFNDRDVPSVSRGQQNCDYYTKIDSARIAAVSSSDKEKRDFAAFSPAANCG